MVKTNCEICNRNFKDESGLAMHNAAIHKGNENPQAKRSYAIWVYFGLAIFVGIVLYLTFFQNSGARTYTSTSSNAVSNPASPSNTDLQKVTISMQNNNYYPNTITVKEGQPVEITLDNSVGGCYRSFNIPQFGISQYSSGPSQKITFTPTEKGTFQFRCGMGMGRGTLIVD